MEVFVFFIFIILIVVAIAPVIVLVKMTSIRNEIDFLDRKFDDLYKKFGDISKQVATKEDTIEILEAIKQITLETERPQKQPIIELIEVEIDKPIEIVPVSIITENQPTEIPTTIEAQNTETAEEPVIEEEVEEETAPAYAAFSAPEKPKDIYADIYPPRRYSTEPQTTDSEGEATHEKSLIERLLTANLLSKIGIITLVLGIGFFVKYAIDQNWINEVGRVGIGLATGGIIIGIAHKLRIKYDVFSSILIGGGISVFYITITLAFREYELFSQTMSFVILIAITIFSVVLSLLYNRKELAIFSLLGGFGAPLMISTGSGNYIVLFSYILILNAGMLIISFRKKWHIIGIISYALTLIFFWSWLFSSFNKEYIGATLFGTLFFIQFYSLAILDHFKTNNKLTPYQAILILTNNLSIFAACLFIFENYAYDVRGIITISIAAINALVMFTLFRRSQVDRNFIYMIIAIVLTFVSLAIPIQLHGHAITMFWAAEAVILLWLWQKSQIQVFRIGFLLLSTLVAVSYVLDISNNYYTFSDQLLPVAVNRIFITGIVVLGSFVISSLLLRKEDPDSDIEISGLYICNLGTAIRTFKVMIILLAFTVPYLELNYQVEVYFDKEYLLSFRYLVLATYTTVFIAILTAILWKNTKHKSLIFSLLSASFALYAIVYSCLVVDLRFDIFNLSGYPAKYFLVHFISLPAIALIATYLVKNIKQQQVFPFGVFGWTMVFLSVVILSIESDNIAILLFSNPETYNSVLYDAQTLGYPILWGVMAMALMVWGLKSKEVLLRKISLFFFGAIIVKFYAYDVWYMSQAGRIVSFVILGVILLLVSFLQQKIKTLVKEDEEKKKEKEENETIG